MFATDWFWELKLSTEMIFCPVITELRCCLSFQSNLHSKNKQNYKHEQLTEKYWQLLSWNSQDWPPDINVESPTTCTSLIPSWLKTEETEHYMNIPIEIQPSGMLPSPPIVNWANDQLPINLCEQYLSCDFLYYNGNITCPDYLSSTWLRNHNKSSQKKEVLQQQKQKKSHYKCKTAR